MPTCKLDGCDRKLFVKKDQLCQRHYMRVRRTGSYDPPPPRTCDKDGCEGAHLARGLCSPHYHREYRRRK